MRAKRTSGITLSLQCGCCQNRSEGIELEVLNCHNNYAWSHPIYLTLRGLADARARALTASSVRFLGAAVVSSELRRRMDAALIWSTAARNAASLTFDGLLKPVTFRTNCNEAARISSSVTGGWKLKSVLMFLHTTVYLAVQGP